MARFFFINAQGTQVGPVDKETLMKSGITRNTLVWKEGAPNWIAAAQEPELSSYFAQVPPAIPTPVQTPPPASPASDHSFSSKPSSYMWLAICTTLLCCLPFGIVSIVYASKVDSNWAVGDYEEAFANSEKAKNWGIASAATGFVLAVIMFIIGMAS